MRTGEIDSEWMVALCGSDRSQGALRLARWLADHAGRGRWRLRGVHVITRDVAVAREHPELMERARLEVRHEIAQLVAEAGAGDSLGEIELIEADSPEDGLREVIRSEGVQALVIGRSAGAHERALVRLGRTARRLLRECEVPVVVAGPDLDPARLESGPVVVAVGLSDHCARATLWARAVAQGLERPLRLVHVARLPDLPGIETVAPEAAERRLAAVRERSELALAQWQADHGFEALTADVVMGTQPAKRLLTHADEVHACLLVCGTRQLELHQRVFESSLSSELASLSALPVAVVPSSLPEATLALDPEHETTPGGNGPLDPSRPSLQDRARADERRALPIGPMAHGLMPWA